MLELPPLSLYIHIPWCVRKCPYCDFNSHENKNRTLPEDDYLNKLKQDLQQEKNQAQGRRLHSIFFGGGTPSLFSAKTIGAILNAAEKTIGFEPSIEITLEANPGTVEQKNFTGYYKAGVNRLSIGVQSFQEEKLTRLGRIHSQQEALNAIKVAKRAGFDNINIDLMHGLPNQSVDDANSDLRSAMDLAPTHISWYQLTIEPNTVFYRQPPPLPAEDILADIQDSGQQLLADSGYIQYEVSAYSQKEKQAKHNINYWSFGDYLGIGAGAHGKITDIACQQIKRRQKTRLPEHYLNGENVPIYKEHIVEKNELPLEFFMNALRLKNGIPKAYFSKRTGLSTDNINESLNKLIQQGLIEDHRDILSTTALGYRFLNTVLNQMLS